MTAAAVVAIAATAFVGAHQIDAARLERDVAWLTSSGVIPRANGSAAADSVARELAHRFLRAGLEPLTGDRFVAEYDASGEVRVEGVIGLRDTRRGYAYGGDWAPLGLSADGHDTTGVAFVGYGITAPEHTYDDYAGIVVAGRTVVALMGEPPCLAGADGAACAPTAHASFYAKASAAAAQGARALVLVPGGRGGGPLSKISSEVTFQPAPIPVIAVSREAGEALLVAASEPLSELERAIDRSGAPRSELVDGHQIEFRVALRRLPARQANVVGVAPGLSSQAVLVCASFDAPDAEWSPREPRPAAVEDASSVAALLAIAEVLPSVARERSVVLAALSGESQDGAGARALAAQVASAGLEVREIVWLTRIGGGVAGTGEGRVLAPDRERHAVIRDVLDAARPTAPWRVAEGIPWARGAQALSRLGAGVVEVRGPGDPACRSLLDTDDRIDPARYLEAARLAYGLVLSLARIAA